MSEELLTGGLPAYAECLRNRHPADLLRDQVSNDVIDSMRQYPARVDELSQFANGSRTRARSRAPKGSLSALPALLDRGAVFSRTAATSFAHAVLPR